MPSDRTSDLDRLLSEAVEAAAPAGPCPDENALAALAEGRVDEQEREALAAHVVGCASCRDVTHALLGAGLSTRAPARVAVLPRWAFALAAGLLVAIGAGVYLATRPSGDAPSTEVALARAMDRVARDVPEAAGALRPLDAKDLGVRSGDPTRGDGGAVAPSGRTVDPRPAFRWDAIPGARAYTVKVIDASGATWTRTTPASSLPWPADVAPLAPGAKFAWQLSADDPHATHIDRGVEETSAADAKEWADVVAAAASVETPLRSLVLAHAALRRGLAGEALEHARAFADAKPGDSLGKATLAAALDRLAAR